MSAISVRELNGAVSKVIARVAAGEVIDVTKSGKIVAEIRPKSVSDARREAARQRLLQMMEHGIPVGAPASYDERTGG